MPPSAGCEWMALISSVCWTLSRMSVQAAIPAITGGSNGPPVGSTGLRNRINVFDVGRAARVRAPLQASETDERFNISKVYCGVRVLSCPPIHPGNLILKAAFRRRRLGNLVPDSKSTGGEKGIKGVCFHNTVSFCHAVEVSLHRPSALGDHRGFVLSQVVATVRPLDQLDSGIGSTCSTWGEQREYVRHSKRARRMND